MPRQEQDRKIFRQRVQSLSKKKASTVFPGQLLLEIGKGFLGTAYAAGTLETKGSERLVVNLRGQDCFTFVEHVVALAWCVTSEKKSFKAFRRILQKVRYRQGRVQGYGSRLHYFSDWMHDNQKKGILKDITPEIGGRPLRKIINFMTTHPDLYPPLNEDVSLRRMKSVERTISRRPLFFIPKKKVRLLEDRIRDGDLIAISTHREGLDIQHVGLAARVKNRIHLLHASSTEGKVVLSKKTLCRYLKESRTRAGIMVARITMKQRARRGKAAPGSP